MKGKVSLVGAGPGDPGLLTLSGKAALDAADTVIHDRLVSEEILCALPPEVRLIDVGKYPSKHPIPQEEINQIMLAEVRKGKRVVRLKGGDPFLFGRGGEEALFLAAEGIPFEVIPGVSSALAVPAAAGIPVTHRGISAGAHIITWHGKGGGPPPPETLRAIAQAGGTLVILMGAAALRRDMGSRLLEAGFAPDTQAALIENGTTPRQKTKILTLQELEPAACSGMAPPLLVVVGPVCALAGRLIPQADSPDSGDAGPLRGSRVVVTRPEPENTETCRRLRALGGEAIPFLCIKRVPIDPPKETFREAGTFPWIVFTSAAGVDFFFEGFLRSGADFRSLGNSRFAVLGPATAAALKKRGFIPDFTPPFFSGRSLGEGLAERMTAGETALLARARQSAPRLSSALGERGVPFQELPLYDTVPTEGGRAARNIIRAGRFDCIFFSSPSAVSAFAGFFPDMDFSAIIALCIGETTGAEARKFGMAVHTAAEATIEGLCRLAAEVTASRSDP